MTNDQMHELARVGAQARLHAIYEERGAILRAFPALGTAPTPASTNGSPAPARRTRKGMSPAQRKAVGERIRAYWAKRRGEKAGTAAPDTQAASDGAASSARRPTKQPSKRKGMSPAARKAQGERMRAYWAARRAEKGAGDGSQTSSRKGRKAGRKK
jgi:hypothetical protein